MALSRRRFISSVTAASALAAAGALEAAPGRALAASPPGDVVGKVSVGYQGWFACIGDGAPINAWWHWSNNWGQPPSPSNNGTLRAWPDMSDYTHRYQTAYANLGNGQPATLFSSYDQQTVDAHFESMRLNDIDTAALQRFNPNSSEGPTRDAMAAKVRGAAESHGRKFYIMYDVTGWTNMQSEIKTDWTAKMSAHTASTAYARQNGKPAVCIWGFGFNDNNHPWSADVCLDVINWFKGQGCYVIGGVPREWRIGINGSRPGFLGTYHAFNMISPWMVGAIGNAGDSDNIYNQLNVGDQADCDANGIDYQPCVLPGDVSARQRVHGDFMWRQFYNMVRVGAQGIYISMFDEFNEGNQICKTAATLADVPTNAGLLALDEDGVACSPDYYLRLTGDGGRMLKGQIALTPVRPTQPNGGAPPPPPTGNLALNKPTSESSHTQNFVSGNAVNGDAGSYWESANNAFPQWLQADLGTAAAVNRVVLKLPPSWGARNQTLSIQGSTNGSAFATLASGTYTFDPGSANTVTISFAAQSARYVRLNVTANTGWPAGQCSELEVYAQTGGTDTPPTAPGNLNSPSHTATSVALSWTASTDDHGVSNYDVRQNGAVVATVTGTSATVSGLNPSTTYSYSVVARDTVGQLSPPSNTINVTTDAAPNTNLARGKATAESSHNQVYVSGNAVDGDANSYWESANNAFPQWIQVDLGSAAAIGRLVLRLPPQSAWGTRTQTLSVQGSTNGSTFSTIVGSAGYTFNPATGNTVTITFTSTSTRYVRLNFTGNTGWPAGQLSEFEVYQS